jgi:hypothetical protein
MERLSYLLQTHRRRVKRAEDLRPGIIERLLCLLQAHRLHAKRAEENLRPSIMGVVSGRGVRRESPNSAALRQDDFVLHDCNDVLPYLHVPMRITPYRGRRIAPMRRGPKKIFGPAS